MRSLEASIVPSLEVIFNDAQMLAAGDKAVNNLMDKVKYLFNKVRLPIIPS